MSTHDFSTLYTTLPHNLINNKLIDLIERNFNRESYPYLACNDRHSDMPKKFHSRSCQNVCDALAFFVGQHFYLIGHQVVQRSSWDSYGH